MLAPVTVTDLAAVCVIAPLVLVTPRVPVATTSFRMMPPVPSVRVTFRPVALTSPTKLLPALPSVMSYFTLPGATTPLSAVRVVAPVTFTSPIVVWVIAPFVVNVKLPAMFRPSVVVVVGAFAATDTEVTDPMIKPLALRKVNAEPGACRSAAMVLTSLLVELKVTVLAVALVVSPKTRKPSAVILAVNPPMLPPPTAFKVTVPPVVAALTSTKRSACPVPPLEAIST